MTMTFSEYKKCPNCQVVFQESIIASAFFAGNTWSDGMIDDLSLRDNPMRHCQFCQHYFWLKDMLPSNIKSEHDFQFDDFTRGEQTHTKWIGFNAIKTLFKKIKKSSPEEHYEHFSDFTIDHMFSFLNSDLVKAPEEECEVRTYIFWAYNDFTRFKNNRNKEKYKTIAEENMAALLPLLRIKTEEERLTKAEVHRLLGQFDEAVALLDMTFSEENEPAAQQMRQWVEQKNTDIQILDL